jgi:hypothetical protein
MSSSKLLALLALLLCARATSALQCSTFCSEKPVIIIGGGMSTHLVRDCPNQLSEILNSYFLCPPRLPAFVLSLPPPSHINIYKSNAHSHFHAFSTVAEPPCLSSPLFFPSRPPSPLFSLVVLHLCARARRHERNLGRARSARGRLPFRPARGARSHWRPHDHAHDARRRTASSRRQLDPRHRTQPAVAAQSAAAHCAHAMATGVLPHSGQRWRHAFRAGTVIRAVASTHASVHFSYCRHSQIIAVVFPDPSSRIFHAIAFFRLIPRFYLI